MKKKILNIFRSKALYIASILLLSTSCADVFLDLDPENAVSDEYAIVDEKTAETALNGAYNRLKSTNYYGGGNFVSAIYLAGNDVTWTGSLN